MPQGKAILRMIAIYRKTVDEFWLKWAQISHSGSCVVVDHQYHKKDVSIASKGWQALVYVIYVNYCQILSNFIQMRYWGIFKVADGKYENEKNAVCTRDVIL